MQQNNNTKALLIAVGESAEKALLTINHCKPEHLLFFATQANERVIEQTIRPGIEQMPKRWDCVITPDPANFSECYRALAKSLNDLLRTWQIQTGELVMDYSGGTPSMVMAMALAATEHSTRMIDTGKVDLSQGGPAQGSRQELLESNPWDHKAADEARQGAMSFNLGRYSEARFVFSRLQERVSGGSKPLYKALSDLAEGYKLWDDFHYQKALEKIKAAKKALELSAVWGGPPGLKSVLNTLSENLLFLEKIMMAQRGADKTIFLDLVANARRRADVFHEYEDAMFRLNRALEVLAQVQLQKVRGIKAQDIRPEQLPESVREEYGRCFTSELDGKIKLPLYAAFQLLKTLDDPLGHAFFTQWEKLKLALDSQNNSILGHGFDSIKPERYQQMYELIMRLSETRSEQLPRFPNLQF